MRSADRVRTAHALANAGQANQNLQQEAGVRRGPESQALGHLVQGRCIIKSSTTNALFLRKSMQKKIELPCQKRISHACSSQDSSVRDT